MKLTIPRPLQDEHEALHERLRQATEAGGEVGEAANEAEWPQMLAEHRSIVDALSKLREAAAPAGRDDVLGFAEVLVEHAQTEEAVMYPAALLVGQVVRQRLGARAAALA